ncbi:hypothetical protein ACJQWK_01676 [Exserohilum turcicum]
MAQKQVELKQSPNPPEPALESRSWRNGWWQPHRRGLGITMIHYLRSSSRTRRNNFLLMDSVAP